MPNLKTKLKKAREKLRKAQKEVNLLEVSLSPSSAAVGRAFRSTPSRVTLVKGITRLGDFEVVTVDERSIELGTWVAESLLGYRRVPIEEFLSTVSNFWKKVGINANKLRQRAR